MSGSESGVGRRFSGSSGQMYNEDSVFKEQYDMIQVSLCDEESSEKGVGRLVCA